MAINGRFRVSMGDVFPARAFVVGDVEALRDFKKPRSGEVRAGKGPGDRCAAVVGRCRRWMQPGAASLKPGRQCQGRSGD